MTRPAELRELPADELRNRLDSAKEELFNLRFQLATGQLDNPMRIKEIRHEVARILTVLREQELEEEHAAAEHEKAGSKEQAPSDEQAEEAS